MAVLAPEWEAGVDRPSAPADEVHVWRTWADREGLALREVLARYLDEDPAGIELRRGEHGKPALADPSSPLRFNLSHSGDLALIAVTQGREVGIDIECIRPRRDLPGLAKRALDPAALATVRSAPADERAAAFHQAWTRREAIAKCLGTGLGAPLPLSRVTVATLYPAPGYAAALAVTGGEVPSLRFFRRGLARAARGRL
jgi:4'-phosphopantetheinyl transferase